MIIEGGAWVFGDSIDTDVLAPGVYMKLPVEELATHCLESVDPTFAASVRPGDVVVGGHNFGMGSSREQAAIALKVLGVGAVLALDVARIFYRNALNIGLPVLFLPEGTVIGKGDRLRVDPVGGTVENLTRGETIAVEPIPGHLMAMLQDGGLVPHLKKRFAGAKV